MNAFTQRALLNKLRNIKKRQKQNGFTLIELMVVVAILAVLMSVGLPELTKAQAKAKASAAESWVTKEAKSCSLALVTGDSYTLATTYPDGVSLATGADKAGDAAPTSSCAKSTSGATAQISADGGGWRYTVTIDEEGIPNTPEKSELP